MTSIGQHDRLSQKREFLLKLKTSACECIDQVDGALPQPSRDSGSLRAVGILKVLVEEGFSVTFASTLVDYPYTEPLHATQMR